LPINPFARAREEDKMFEISTRRDGKGGADDSDVVENNELIGMITMAEVPASPIGRVAIRARPVLLRSIQDWGATELALSAMVPLGVSSCLLTAAPTQSPFDR
jgi:hypothetical protein